MSKASLEARCTAGEAGAVEEGLRRMIDGLPQPAALFTPRGQVLYLNAAALEMCGHPDACPPGLPLSWLQPEWACALLSEEGIPAAVRDGQWQGESALLRAGVGEVPAEQSLISVGGREAPLLASLWRDVSYRKRMSLERIEAANAYDAAIRGSGQVLFRWEVATGGIHYQGDVQALTGFTPSELEGGLKSLRDRIHPEDLAHFDSDVQRATAARGPVHLEFRLQRPGGDFVCLQARGGFFLDRTGHLAHVAGLLTDVTTLRQAQEQLTLFRERIERHTPLRVHDQQAVSAEGRQALEELWARLSHKLRTPLNAILGFTQLLELEALTGRQAESVAHVSRAGQQLVNLINHALETVPDPAAAREPAPADSGETVRPGSYQLLYVEDELLNIQLVERVVEAFPEYQLLSATTGAAALLRARESRPDLILLDLHLPDQSGESVLAELKADPQLRHIPVIMVTAEMLGPRADEILAAGALTYLTKPFRISEFLAAIRAALAQSRPAAAG